MNATRSPTAPSQTPSSAMHEVREWVCDTTNLDPNDSGDIINPILEVLSKQGCRKVKQLHMKRRKHVRLLMKKLREEPTLVGRDLVLQFIEDELMDMCKEQ